MVNGIDALLLASQARGGDSPMQTVEPEYFVVAEGATDDYLRGFLSAAEAISRDLGRAGGDEADEEVDAQVLGSQAPVQAAYTAAGQAALNNGCLIVAAAGSAGSAVFTGSPAKSPTIFAVASLDSALAPSAFSCSGKIEIAAPGRDVFSSVPRPTRSGTKSGTSMATPPVAGVADVSPDAPVDIGPPG